MTRLRSVLYIPGANERALQKARELPADALILDLEDAVAPAAKELARTRVCAARSTYADKTVAIRVNGIGTEWHEADVRACAAAEPDAIVIPKVNAASDVHAIERMLSAATLNDTKIWAMLETPAAVLAATDISSASDRLEVLVMGTNDLLNEIYAPAVAGRATLQVGLSMCLLAARAAGKQILDGVYNDVRNLQGFKIECRQGVLMGFDGKTLIHPTQIEVSNKLFSPSAEEIDHAQRVIAAFQDAQEAGAGVATLDGRLIESLHVETAERVLSLAQDL